jgi:hypothetical protein
MPVFRVFQKVSHEEVPNSIVKTTRITGRDLKHAIELIRASPGIKRDLAKKYWAKETDSRGRTLYIEIEAEERYTLDSSKPKDH